jgi:hypothetical protein
MRPIGYLVPAVIGSFLALSSIGPAVSDVAAATPNPNGAFLNLRVFNDCPSSVLTTGNTYPASVFFQDDNLSCGGFANLHNWHLSEDGGATEAVYNNNSNYHYCATMTISGTAEGEAGLQVAPWWSQQVDGRFNVRTTDGEVACFGGRLPFYSFTGSDGVVYTKGNPITLEITYLANGLSAASPATIEYELTYLATSYSSGPLPFDEGNPLEGKGSWGALDDARVGGYMQAFLQAGNPNAGLRADWTDHCYDNLDSPIAVEPTSWSRLKNVLNK